MEKLELAVGRCATEFAAMSKTGQAETVRGYANDRASRVQNALRSYEQALREYFGIMGIRVLPLGVSGTTSG
jgi:hypothetical protein